jgi:hypothetical protein
LRAIRSTPRWRRPLNTPSPRCLTLEIDDDELTEQHLVKFIAAAQKVAEKRRELRALLATPPSIEGEAAK